MQKLGGTRVRLYFKVLKEYKLYSPSSSEQTAIGTFFRTLDDTIKLQKRKVDGLKRLKKSYLQQMFPKADESVPRMRFSGFTGAWAKRKLGDAAKIIMGQSPSSNNYTNNPKDYILVQGNADIKNGFVVPRVWTTQVTKRANKGDLILSVRAPVGDVGKTNYDVVLGRGVAAIRGNEFLYHMLTKMNYDGFWVKLSTGSTFDSITSDNIHDAEVLLPSPDEQTAIGHFFHSLDEQISDHQQKLNQLQQLKAAYLQNMFV